MSNICLLFNSGIKSFRIAFLGLLVMISHTGFAQVTIGAGTGGTNICVNKWTGGSTPAFTTLGNITIREANTNDIPHPCGGTCNVLLYLNAPTGWEFSGTLPTVTHFNWATGGANDITSVVPSYISSTQLLLTIRVHGAIHHDEIRIANLQVEATTSTVTSAGFIYASGGSGINGITAGTTGVAGTGGTNFGNVSQTGGTTPTVSITPTPTYTICPGASVTFSATATGTITSYQWFVNGAATATGNPFTTTTLASGNTVYCEVFASGCGASTLTATSSTTTVTVTGPGLISGNPSLCIGSSNTLSDATSGGTWSSTASGIASVGSTGIATGVSAGTATISYYPGSGCAAILNVTVAALPPTPTISPATATICNGGSVTLTAAGTYYFDTILAQNFNSGLGVWTVDTIGSVNLLPGSQWKVDGDGYINDLGVYHSPDNSAFILANADTSGPTSTTSTHLYSPVFSLVGYTTATLSFEQFYNFNIDDVIAEVDISTDGGVTWGLLADYWGTTAGAYTAFATETIDLTPYLGMSNLKIEYNYTSSYGSSWAVDNINITGTHPITGPIWTPSTYLFSNSSLTTTYSGLSADPVYVHPTTVTVPTVVTYTATVTSSITGCSASSTSTVTINPVPAAISGTPDVCIGSITALTDATVGGTWSSTATGIGSVDGSGNVTGVGSGTTTISYTSGLGCAATSIVTVAAVPGGITGTLTMCNGSSSTLSDAVPGGTWSSSSPGTASVGSTTGIVTGASIGTAIITYATSPVCYVTTTVTVTAPPNNIISSASACQGTSIICHETTTGGTWSSSNTAVGSIVATVVTPPSATVLGESAGTTTITYALSPTCYVTKNLTFLGIPTAITGPSIVCSGFTINLTDATTGGTWSSSASAIAAVGSTTGVVTGGSVGTATITYKTAVGATTCGIATVNVTVTVAPTAIFGATSVCTEATITLTNGTSGGTWSSSSPGIGSIDPS